MGRVRRAAACSALLTGVLVLTAPPPPAGAAVGPVYAWGDNSLGQLGNGTSTGRLVPGTVPSTTLPAVAGGRGHVLGLRADGTVVAWGANAEGEIGDGTTTDRHSPVTVAGLSNIREVDAGHNHSLAIGQDGSLWAWGLGVSGQLGIGTTSNGLRPARVTVISNVVSAVGGRDHSLALTGDGSVWAWGANANGEVGDGTLSRRTTPVRVTGVPAIVGIAAARNTSYAWTAAGALWAWGRNDYGQVGDGTTTDRTRPVAITAVSGVTSVAAGAFHVLALTTAGQVWTWGFNSYGNLGDGTTTRRGVPRVVSGLSGITGIGVGRDHSLAITSSAGLMAWGRNDFGQLGDGTTVNRTRPVAVPGIVGVTSVGGGRDDTVASTATGPSDTTPPTTPGTPTATSSAPGTVVVTWPASHDDVASSIRYDVYRDGGAMPTGTLTSASTTTVSFTDSGLAGGSVHTYRVTASDGSNVSAPGEESDPVTVASDTTPPTTPGKPAATSSASGTVVVTWPASHDDVASSIRYDVYRDDAQTVAGTVTSASTTTVSFTDSGLAGGSVHTYRVTASDGSNVSPPSEWSDPVTVASGPSALFQDDFSSGFTRWMTVVNLTLDSSRFPATGSAPSARAAVNNQVGYAVAALSQTAPSVCAEASVNVGSLTSPTLSLIRLRTTTNASIGRVYVAPNGRLSVRADFTGAVLSATSSLPFGSWHQLRLCGAIGASGNWQLYLDGTLVGSWTTNNGSAPFGRVQVADSDAKTGTVNVDNVVVD